MSWRRADNGDPVNGFRKPPDVDVDGDPVNGFLGSAEVVGDPVNGFRRSSSLQPPLNNFYYLQIVLN